MKNCIILKLMLVLFFSSFGCILVNARNNPIDIEKKDSMFLEKKFKEIIPLLIDSIDTEEVDICIKYKNPMISDLRPYYYPRGLKYINSINFLLRAELVLLEEKLMNFDVNDFTHKVQTSGLLAKDSKGTLICNDLKHDDLKIIKNAYLSWWNRNKQNSMTKIREDVLLGKELILSPPYFWITGLNSLNISDY